MRNLIKLFISILICNMTAHANQSTFKLFKKCDLLVHKMHRQYQTLPEHNSLATWPHEHRTVALNGMISAAYKAGDSLINDFNKLENVEFSNKGIGNFVSAADYKSERILVEELKKIKPNVGFLTEESGKITGNNQDLLWIIDPLDGTSNFLHGIPHFAISIALKEKEEVVAGVIYNPVSNELFYAKKGEGAFLNKRRSKVSQRVNLQDCLIGTGTPYSRHSHSKEFFTLMEKVVPKIGSLRRMGSAALDLAYVSSGRLDGYFETGLSTWDVAAGILLVNEAGGTVSEINGGDNMINSGSVLATNPKIYTLLKNLL